MYRICLILLACTSSAVHAQQTPVRLNLWLMTEELSTDSVAKEMLKVAREQGYEISISEYSQAGFDEAMAKAKARGEGYPDIVAGLRGPSEMTDYVYCRGFLTGIGSSQSAARVFLFRLSKNHEKAVDLARLKYGESARLPTQWSYTERKFKQSGWSKNRRERLKLRKLARDATQGFLEGNREALASLWHPEALSLQRKRDRVGVSRYKREPGSTRITYLNGNNNLAFAYGLSGITDRSKADQQIKVVGSIPIISVWRKHEASWRLMVITDDPISVRQLPKIAKLCEQLTDKPSEAPRKPTLLSPDDGQVAKAKEGQRFGDYQWRLNDKPFIELAEFDYGYGTRFVVNPGGLLSAGDLWTVRDKWFWRVWSVGSDGKLAVSKARTFRE